MNEFLLQYCLVTKYNSFALTCHQELIRISIIPYFALHISLSPEPPIHSPVGRNGFDMQSDVYKMLQDNVEPVSEPKQSGSFKYLQGILEAEDGGRGYCVCVCL